MPKLYGMHHLELRPEVTPDAFETFVSAELGRTMLRPGQRMYVLKGDRGERAGKYMFVFEYDSVADRDRDSPGSNQDSEELKQWLEENYDAVGRLFDRLSTFVVPGWGIGEHYTDYIALGP